MLWYRKATYKDILAIGPCLREADRSEFQAASGKSPEVALKEAYRFTSGVVFTILKDTTPVGILGIGDYLQEPVGFVRVPWMCGTDLLASSGLEFLRAFKECYQQVFNPDIPLSNWIDSRNTLHLKWIEWMGFIVHRDLGREIRGVTFYPFEYKPCAYQQPQ